MEQPRKKRRKYMSASYLKSGAAYYGALLFLIAQIVDFIELIKRAVKRKGAGMAVPENFTFGGISWEILLIAFIGWIFVLMARQRRGKTRMPRGNLYLLLNLLLTLWGIVLAAGCIGDMALFDIMLLIDALSYVAAIIAPCVILQLYDRKREVPDEMILLFLGAGAIGFCVISFISSIVIVKASAQTADYSFWSDVPQILQRAGVMLYGLATVLKALRIRASYPLAVPEESGEVPPPEDGIDYGTERIVIPKITCPDCGKRVPVNLSNCPRCGREMGDVPIQLFPDK